MYVIGEYFLNDNPIYQTWDLQKIVTNSLYEDEELAKLHEAELNKKSRSSVRYRIIEVERGSHTKQSDEWLYMENMIKLVNSETVSAILLEVDIKKTHFAVTKSKEINGKNCVKQLDLELVVNELVREGVFHTDIEGKHYFYVTAMLGDVIARKIVNDGNDIALVDSKLLSM